MVPVAELIDPSEIVLGKPSVDPDYLGQVNNIAESIKVTGSIFHKPAIKRTREIIYGTKRVLAAIIAGLDSIEVNVYDDGLPANFYRALSLQENLKRYNLPWYEQVVAEKELHELRQDEHGIAKSGKKVGWSLRDTAAELNVALGTLSEDLRMAEAVLANPSLRRVEDKMTARRVILTGIKRVIQENDARVSSQQDNFDVVLQGDSAMVLTAFSDSTFDACITDPPWIEFKDDALVKDEFTLAVFKEVFRVLKPNGFLYAFVSTTDWIIYQREFAKIGYSVQKWPLIWVKEGVLSHGQRSWEYQRDYEPIILAVKGAPALTASLLSSVMSCKAVHSAQLVHPNQKPPEIIKRIIDQCTFEGAVILDPFGGSGETAVTARDMRRKYVTIERDPRYCAAIKERLK